MEVSRADLEKNYRNLNVSFELWKGESDAQKYIPGLIQDGTNGRLCRPGDVEGMAEAVIRLLEEDAVREEYGGTARKNAVQHYSLERHLDKLARVYTSVARKGRRA